MSSELTQRTWDSDFFGFPVYGVKIPADFNTWHTFAELSEQKDIRLLYVYVALPVGVGTHDVVLSEIQNKLKLFPGVRLCQGPFIRMEFEKKIELSESSISSLRPGFQLSDKEILLQLALLSGRYSRFHLDPEIPAERFQQLYKLWLERSFTDDPDHTLFVYRKDYKVAGFITVEKVNDQQAEIELIAVDPDLQRTGIGKILIQQACRWAASRGCSQLVVATQSENREACGLYSASGFSITKKTAIWHLWY